MTDIARRAGSLEERRAALAMSGFDVWLYRRGERWVIVSWPIALWAFGCSITAPWVVASTALFLLFPALGGLYWAMRVEAIHAAITRGDDATAALLLTAPRVASQ
jgi:hypothetical protein